MKPLEERPDDSMASFVNGNTEQYWFGRARIFLILPIPIDNSSRIHSITSEVQPGVHGGECNGERRQELCEYSVNPLVFHGFFG
jgi:hypothetical protein